MIQPSEDPPNVPPGPKERECHTFLEGSDLQTWASQLVKGSKMTNFNKM